MNILAYENIQELKTHGDLNFPFNIYPCSIPFDFSSVPLHWHNDMEILFIKKGQGIVSVNLADHLVSAGDIILICPGQLHSIEQKEDQTMGVSFIDYLNDYRLTMAARMLSASPDPIVSIAAETGFENLSYFNRMFKRKFKMTPSAFRRKQETSV